MFHKENSSVVTTTFHNKQQKKAPTTTAKDTPVRKSDRKRLLQTAVDAMFLGNNDSSQKILQDAFLKGLLVQRSLKPVSSSGDGACYCSVKLYFRSPNHHDDEEEDAWPYRESAQCLWLQVEEGRSAIHEVPGLALLAVLPPDDFSFPPVTVPPNASKFVCRGAHVMRAGILSLPELRQKNPVVVSVAVEGNPQPFAVGLLHPDLLQTTAGELYGPGTKGTGVTVVHCYGDDLWRKQLPTASSTSRQQQQKSVVSEVGGEPFDEGNYGNVGFVNGQYVVPITTGTTTTAEEEAQIQETANIHEAPSVAATKEDAVPELASDDETDVGDTVGNDDDNDDDDDLSPEQVLHAAVCAALVSLNAKKDLPMLMATFYAQHVLPNRPVGSTVQLKQTKWKKFGSYVAEQVQEGLLTVGPAAGASKKDPMAMLTGYDRRHADLKEYIQQRKDAPAMDDKNNKRLVLATLYCIPNHFVALLRLDRDMVKAADATSVERRNTGMLTVKELRSILEDYIIREELVSANRPDQVNLDGPLTDTLYKKKKKKGNDTATSTSDSSSTPPTSLSRKELTKLWEARQEPAYALVEVPGNTIIKLGGGKPPVVTIEVSRRQSNKFVTRILGLEAYGVSPPAFAKDVSSRFACSATVGPTATTSAPTELLFQGNLADELEALLLSDESLTSHGGVKGSTYRLPKDAIQVVLRKGVPARKKRSGKKK